MDAVLSSNSEERRALFEEVAGINKYKHRKKEALKKLEQTRLNLLRVSDIISELESQLGPLSEQSEKAQQYQVINEELTVLQLSLLVDAIPGAAEQPAALARAGRRAAARTGGTAPCAAAERGERNHAARRVAGHRR